MDDIFSFRRIKNGIVLERRYFDFDGTSQTEEIVYQDDFSEVEAFASFLQTINEEYGPAYNKWGAKNIYISIDPGKNFNDH